MRLWRLLRVLLCWPEPTCFPRPCRRTSCLANVDCLTRNFRLPSTAHCCSTALLCCLRRFEVVLRADARCVADVKLRATVLRQLTSDVTPLALPYASCDAALFVSIYVAVIGGDINRNHRLVECHVEAGSPRQTPSQRLSTTTAYRITSCGVRVVHPRCTLSASCSRVHVGGCTCSQRVCGCENQVTECLDELWPHTIPMHSRA